MGNHGGVPTIIANLLMAILHAIALLYLLALLAVGVGLCYFEHFMLNGRKTAPVGREGPVDVGISLFLSM